VNTATIDDVNISKETKTSEFGHLSIRPRVNKLAASEDFAFWSPDHGRGLRPPPWASSEPFHARNGFPTAIPASPESYKIPRNYPALAQRRIACEPLISVSRSVETPSIPSMIRPSTKCSGDDNEVAMIAFAVQLVHSRSPSASRSFQQRKTETETPLLSTLFRPGRPTSLAPLDPVACLYKKKAGGNSSHK